MQCLACELSLKQGVQTPLHTCSMGMTLLLFPSMHLSTLDTMSLHETGGYLVNDLSRLLHESGGYLVNGLSLVLLFSGPLLH